MNLEKLTRKIIALENRNQVNYASVAGNAFSLSKGETTVGIDQNGHMVCNNIFEATNVKADNEKRLKEAENDIERLEQKKADINHTHDEYALKEHEHDEYALKEHEHDIDDINGIDENLESLRAFINQINNMFIIKEHTHEIKDVNQLQETLDSFQESYVDNLESLQQSLTEAFRLKADKEHTHPISDINGLQPQINSMTQDTLFLMQEIVKKPNKEHAHEISDINGLQDALDLKVEHPHFHEVEDINSLQGLLDDIDWRIDMHTHVSQEITDLKSAILDMVYPVGAIYISMTNTHPSILFGGEWNQIVDTFLYCANSAGGSGGSKKITVENLPPHTHSTNIMNANEEVEDMKLSDDGTKFSNRVVVLGTYTVGYNTSSTGSGTDYMPPYMNVNAWIRTA